MKTILWTKHKLKEIKKAYAKALELKQESFFFEGNEFVTEYAKYLIEYLEPQFQ
jgi:hypothetical protein